jgi:hypothetical protein
LHAEGDLVSEVRREFKGAAVHAAVPRTTVSVGVLAAAVTTAGAVSSPAWRGGRVQDPWYGHLGAQCAPSRKPGARCALRARLTARRQSQAGSGVRVRRSAEGSLAGLAYTTPPGRTGYSPVGAENLCHQAILMNHAADAVTSLNPDPIKVGDVAGQPA